MTADYIQATCCFQLALEAKDAGDLQAYFTQLRRMYDSIRPDIDAGRYAANFCEWSLLLTPIEREVWVELRRLGGHFYPQFPVGRFFVDFGNPWTKTAIECDGKAWHSQDRDNARDRLLMHQHGWETWRLSGREIWQQQPIDAEADDPTDAEMMLRFLCGKSTIYQGHPAQ